MMKSGLVHSLTKKEWCESQSHSHTQKKAVV